MVYEHGIDDQDILDNLPTQRSTGQITETSKGLNLPLLRKWRTQGSAIINTALEQNGYTDFATELKPNAAEFCKVAILNYINYQAIIRSGTLSNTSEEAQRYKDEWEKSLMEVRRMPEYLGASVPANTTFQTNLDQNHCPSNYYSSGKRVW